ncbi:MAG: hypothetical protein ACREOP_06280 [Thermodesulfobacteriota bacterium]
MSKRKPYTLEHTKEARRVIKALRGTLEEALNITQSFYAGLDDEESRAWRKEAWGLLDETRDLVKEVL